MMIRNYLETQLSKEELETLSADRKRAGQLGGRRSADRRRVEASAETTAEASAQASDEASGAPSDEAKSQLKEKEKEKEREDVLRTSSPARDLGHLLIQLLNDNGCRAPAEVPPDWLNAADRLLEGRAPAEVTAVLRWAVADDFWAAVVLDLPHFERSYDQIRLQSQRGIGYKPKPGGAQERADRYGEMARQLEQQQQQVEEETQ